jgi:hypothetical protein
MSRSISSTSSISAFSIDPEITHDEAPDTSGVYVRRPSAQSLVWTVWSFPSGQLFLIPTLMFILGTCTCVWSNESTSYFHVKPDIWTYYLLGIFLTKVSSRFGKWPWHRWSQFLYHLDKTHVLLVHGLLYMWFRLIRRWTEIQGSVPCRSRYITLTPNLKFSKMWTRFLYKLDSFLWYICFKKNTL